MLFAYHNSYYWLISRYANLLHIREYRQTNKLTNHADGLWWDPCSGLRGLGLEINRGFEAWMKEYPLFPRNYAPPPNLRSITLDFRRNPRLPSSPATLGDRWKVWRKDTTFTNKRSVVPGTTVAPWKINDESIFVLLKTARDAKPPLDTLCSSVS